MLTKLNKKSNSIFLLIYRTICFRTYKVSNFISHYK